MAWRRYEFCGMGGCHGVGQVCEKAFDVGKQEKHDVFWLIRVAYVFLFVSILWIFFRVSTVSDAWYILKNIFVGLNDPYTYIHSGVHALGITRVIAIKIALLYLAPLFVYDWLSLKNDVCEWIGGRNIVIRYSYVIMVILAILTMGYVGQSTFVYFQF